MIRAVNLLSISWLLDQSCQPQWVLWVDINFMQINLCWEYTSRAQFTAECVDLELSSGETLTFISPVI